MREQLLNAYVLHARPYQEKRAIYHCFSLEFGLVQGIASRGVPMFVLLQLLANGKHSLKNFSQIHLTYSAATTVCRGQSQYALLYLNEILCRLLVPENPCAALFYRYQQAVYELWQLDTPDKSNQLQQIKVCLRRFEKALFEELGVSIDFLHDHAGQKISSGYYQFNPSEGFVRVQEDLLSQQNSPMLWFDGDELLQMADDKNLPKFLDGYGKIYRQMLDFLLDYKPLNSRKLWLEYQKYQC